MILWRHQIASEWELVTRKPNYMIRELEVSVPLPKLWGGQRGWRLTSAPQQANDLITHAYIMKSS